MDKNKIYYVYEWYIIETNEIFYVGKGKDNRYKTVKRNKFFNDMYNSHNCNVRIVYDKLSEKEAFAKEIELIKYYRKNFLKYRLTNQTDGGEGISGWKAPNKFKEKISKLVKGKNNPNYNNNWTEEQKERLRKIQKQNPIYKNESNPNAKRIMCLETGEIFECIKYCLIKYFIKNETSISIALKERQRTAGGLHWIEINNKNINYFKIDQNRINYLIESISLNKNYVGIICIEDKIIFNSKKSLSNFLNITVAKINWSLKKIGKLIHNNKTYILIKDYSRLI